MKRLTIIVTVILLFAVAVTNVFAVSEAALLFLLISPHARVAGMGEAFVGLADDVSAIYYNPAGLAFQQGKQFTSMYVKWLPQFNLSDLYYVFGAYRQSIEGLGTVAGDITFLNLGQQTRTNADGFEEGTFNSSEWAITLSYATLLSKTFGLGINFRFIRSNLSDRGAGAELGSGKASAFAFDVGILKKNLIVNRLNFGLDISNVGPKISYIDDAQADPIPTNFRAGFAYRAVDQEFNKLTFVFDVNKLLVNRKDDGTPDSVFKAFFSSWGNNDIILNLGGEYWYADLIALRAGYNHDPDGNLKYLTFGAGLRYSIYQFDFSYITDKDSAVSNTIRFSLSVGK
ncbi:MAG: PorV/PorQ family protein [bacterium]